MRIMIDQAIPSAPGLFSRLGEVRTFDGRSLRAADLVDAEALIVRSVTRVDAALLAGSRVRFVGTATSGTDHVDEAWLAREGIHFAAARGCNARPVAEYVLTAILWLAQQRQFDPRTKTLGVVGVGHTGSLVARWAHALGMEVLLCDPPLQDEGRSGSLSLCSNTSERPNGLLLPPLRGGTEGGSSPPPIDAPSSHWLSQPELLAQCDIITLHVPLTLEGPHATREMVNPRWLGSMQPGRMLINTARGEVVEESALIKARQGGRLAGLVVDVWKGESVINERLAAVCDIATPHIAGYSVEAKRRAVATICDALAEWAGVPTPTVPPSAIPPPASRAVLGPGAEPNRDRQRAVTLCNRDLSAMLDPLQTACSLSNIDDSLRLAMADGTLAERFDRLRSEVSQRREFPHHRLNTVQFSPAVAEFLVKVGFSLSEPIPGPQTGP